MRHYTFAFLCDYFSARGRLLVRERGQSADGRYRWKYVLTNGAADETFANLTEVTARALRG